MSISSVDVLHEGATTSISSGLFSGRIISSDNINLSVAPNIWAICRTVVRQIVDVGRRESGSEGMHSGRNSFLLKVGLYSVKTARQNKNLDNIERKGFEIIYFSDVVLNSS